MQKRNKKAAIELSINTIVIIVLAMSMLILGLVLIKNLFQGSTENVTQITDKVRDQINQLFVEDVKTVVYLPNQKAVIKQNQDWGVAFAIKNLIQGKAEDSSFSYEVVVSDPNVQKNCGISEREVESWIVTGQSDTGISIAPGDTFVSTVRFFIPTGSPLCTVRFHLNVKESGKVYDTKSFDVQVVAK
jgi:hypothetical protein